MKKKKVALHAITALAGIALVASLAACTGGPAATGSGEASTSVLQKVIDSKKLTVGMTLQIPPYESKDASGEPVGYDVEIAQLLADSLGAELEIVDMAPDARIPNVQTGKVDVLFTDITITNERALTIDFTDPYASSGPVVVALEDGVTSLADLDGKKVGVLKGTTFDAMATEKLPAAEAVYFDSNPDQITALQNGQIDAFLQDGNSAAYLTLEFPDLRLVKGDLGAPEYNGFAIQKGDQIWLNYLNRFIFSIEADGTSETLFEKYFGTERPFSPRLG